MGCHDIKGKGNKGRKIQTRRKCMKTKRNKVINWGKIMKETDRKKLNE